MKSSKAKPTEPPHTITVPRSQVTSDPTPGYTTSDFWRDQANPGRPTEYERFEDTLSNLAQVPKSEVDEKLRGS